MPWKSFRRRSPQRAIALMTAMLSCLFLLMLTGALIQTQSSAFAVAQSSDARVRARAACQSLYDFCLYQLEHNRNWGRDGFTELLEVNPPRETPGGQTTTALEDRITIDEVDGRIFRGYLSEHNTSFEVEVVNALTSASGAVSSKGLPTAHQQVRLAITTREGKLGQTGPRASQQVDCLLRLAPLFDAAVLSRGNIEVDAEEALFSSHDPFRNEIRAEGNVILPGLTQGRTRFVAHTADVIRKNSDLEDMEFDKTGLLWAGRDIGQNLAAGGSADILNSSTTLGEAARRSGGRMVNKASNRADIYDLKPENIPQPSFPPERDIVVPPGEYRFTKAVATITYEVTVTDPEGNKSTQTRTKQEVIDVLQYHDPPHSAEPAKVMRTPTSLLGEGESLKQVRIDYGDSDFSDIPVVVGEKFGVDTKYNEPITVKDRLGNDHSVSEGGFKKMDALATAPPVTIDLTTQTVTVAPETRVRPAPRPAQSSQSPSAFELTVKSGPDGNKPQRPTFVLGNGNNDVVFEADGDISIGEGYTKGLGTIISKKGNVTLNPVPQELKWVQKYFHGSKVPVWVLEREMEVSTNSNYAGLVIYAEKDVTISNTVTGTSQADWAFRGFVYARGNFHFDVAGQNATFFGSVVAGNDPSRAGAFRIHNADRATFVYDPAYLKLLTQQLPYNWTRVEPLFWSEANG